MRRLHLFEFTDMAWYPRPFRRIQTDYLQFVATRGAGHENLVPLFEKALAAAGTREIVDLCSGGTGPWERLRGHLAEAGLPVSVTLTDLYPDPDAASQWARASAGDIEYLAEPVDAVAVPESLTGMRTLFEGFHHFKPEEAERILRHAMEKRAAIGVFEASLPRPPIGPLILLLSPLMTLLGYFFATPFIRPRRLSRFLWTYIPIVPLATCWDGVVSLLRVYSVRDLEAMTAGLVSPGYRWEAGLASTGTPLFEFTYLIGYPVQENAGINGGAR
jgi:hypothetical protein